MSLITALARRLALAAVFMFVLSLSIESAELADFHAAVEAATADYRVAMTTLETSGQAETTAAVQRFRASWQAINDRFGRERPAVFVDAEDFMRTFVLVDVRLIGVLLTINMGNRDAAREGLTSVGDTLADLSARSAPARSNNRN